MSDDFLYARSVDIVVSDGELLILPASAVTVLFQVGWGAIFSFIFGHSFGVLRASTVIFTLGSSLAVYGLCRELRLDKVRSALGTAVFLFSPLGYVLSFTFMTDRYFVGLLAVSATPPLSRSTTWSRRSRWRHLPSCAGSSTRRGCKTTRRTSTCCGIPPRGPVATALGGCRESR